MPNKATYLFVITRNERPRLELAQATPEEFEKIETHINRFIEYYGGGRGGRNVWCFELKPSTMEPSGQLEMCTNLYMKAHYFPDVELDNHMQDLCNKIDLYTTSSAKKILEEGIAKLQSKLVEINEEIEQEQAQSGTIVPKEEGGQLG